VSTDLPLLSQLYSHDSSAAPISVVSAALRDIVFQSYLPNMIATTSVITNDRSNVVPLSQEPGSPIPLDGFIEQSDELFAEIGAAPSNALTLEANTVNNIVRSLRDVEAPAERSLAEPAAVGELNAGNLPTFTIDLQTDFTLDEVAALPVEGGMVLLQSTGDANASSFDLTPLYATHMDSLVAPTSMEASVGVYQALDVAADESPVAESQPAGTSANSSMEVNTQTSLPLKREHDTSHKAASVLGVTALTGAMVWMSRHRSEAEEVPQAAQKRRALSA
jgi:hypothetical protein